MPASELGAELGVELLVATGVSGAVSLFGEVHPIKVTVSISSAETIHFPVFIRIDSHTSSSAGNRAGSLHQSPILSTITLKRGHRQIGW